MTGMVKGLMKSGGGSADIAHNAKRNFRLDDGTELAGEWDEASLMPMNCCIFLALRGDQLITMDFTASTATLRQAAGLVDSAYKRIDQPLRIDGGAGVAAAKALDKTRPQPVEVCSLLARADVEAILGKLASDPKPRQERVRVPAALTGHAAADLRRGAALARRLLPVALGPLREPHRQGGRRPDGRRRHQADGPSAARAGAGQPRAGRPRRRSGRAAIRPSRSRTTACTS